MTEEDKPVMPSIIADSLQDVDFERMEVEGSEEFLTLPIEAVASNAIDELIELKESMDADELHAPPESPDTRVNFRANDLFVREEIVPIVNVLMMRTERKLKTGTESNSGYVFIDPDESFGVTGVYYFIDDEDDVDYDDYYAALDTPKDVEEAWETSRKKVRDDLWAFSRLTKRDIINKFIEYAEEYDIIDPAEEELTLGL